MLIQEDVPLPKRTKVSQKQAPKQIAQPKRLDLKHQQKVESKPHHRETLSLDLPGSIADLSNQLKIPLQPSGTHNAKDLQNKTQKPPEQEKHKNEEEKKEALNKGMVRKHHKSMKALPMHIELHNPKQIIQNCKEKDHKIDNKKKKKIADNKGDVEIPMDIEHGIQNPEESGLNQNEKPCSAVTIHAINHFSTSNTDASLVQQNMFFTPDCLSKHSISIQLRAKMLNWMVEVLSTYESNQETWFFTASIIDTYYYTITK
jgi:hypothetical protein